ncbi:ABC transporter permease subunit [Leucobacter allii]|uniref:ABC transporter permease n=1 Tax=Leucobacter allii TaxID=2932247 RepID=UPI001FD45417|nr:ABC transporter permease subunit [Leucobacter allii]UOR01873.1 ABC transporter permease subunit [Leucobacter allii]
MRPTVTRRGRLAVALWQIWLPLALLLLWFVASAGSSSPFWPPLSDIFAAMLDWALGGGMAADLAFSFGNYLVALALALLVGIGAGIVIGLTPRAARVLDPYLDLLRSLPIVVFVPIVVLVLGIGAFPKIFLIAVACVWPILLHTIEGVRSIAPSVFEAGRAYRIPLGLSVRKIVLPGALPQIVVGVRLAITVGLVMLVVSEMYGSTHGVGYFILNSSQRFKLADAWAGTLLVGVIGWAITQAYAALEHRLLAWYRQDDGAPASRR